jgi:hypothetical protein
VIRFNPETTQRSLDALRWGLIPQSSGSPACHPLAQAASPRYLRIAQGTAAMADERNRWDCPHQATDRLHRGWSAWPVVSVGRYGRAKRTSWWWPQTRSNSSSWSDAGSRKWKGFVRLRNTCRQPGAVNAQTNIQLRARTALNLILKVTSTTPKAELSELLRHPLGLDIWEVKADHLVLGAGEPQAHRLQQIGYTVDQLHQTASLLETFAAAEAKSIVDPADLNRTVTLADRMQSLIKDVHGMTNVAQPASQLYPTAGDPPTGPMAFTTLSNCVRATLTEAALSFRPTRFKLRGRKISRLPWSLSDTFLSPNHICQSQR